MVHPAPTPQPTARPGRRVEGVATSVSWVPAPTVAAAPAGWAAGAATDGAPPERVDGLAALVQAGAADRFRFANRIAAWAEIVDGTIVDAGFAADSQGVMGGPALRTGGPAVRFAAVSLPLLRETAYRGHDRVVFRQTSGGRSAPTLTHPPTAKVLVPLVWTTLELTLHADGRVVHRLAGASAFPLHRVHDGTGEPTDTSGTADPDHWAQAGSAEHSPWGGPESAALVGAIESALHRQISSVIMRDTGRPDIRTLQPGAALTRQGEPTAGELFLVLDGVLSAAADGCELGLLGPGTVLGGRALLENGVGTSTVTARTAARVAVVPAAAVDRDALRRISDG